MQMLGEYKVAHATGPSFGWSGRDAVCGRSTVQSDLSRSERVRFVSIQSLRCGDKEREVLEDRERWEETSDAPPGDFQ
jgi:hypothetical protein